MNFYINFIRQMVKMNVKRWKRSTLEYDSDAHHKDTQNVQSIKFGDKYYLHNYVQSSIEAGGSASANNWWFSSSSLHFTQFAKVWNSSQLDFELHSMAESALGLLLFRNST